MSPRRTTERDGSDGRHRRMSLRQEAETDGPSVFMSFYLGDIRLRLSSWPSQSRRRTSPRRMAPRRMPLRRMSPRRRKAETEEDRDGCPRDGRCVFFKIVEGLSECYCLISFEWCVWVQQCLSLVDDSGGVFGCGWVVVWVCRGACCGGGDGRKSIFCRRIEF